MTLSGTETLNVLPTRSTGEPSAETIQTTTGAIAALASSTGVGETAFTSIATVGNGTLTAAGIIGGGISRSGPVAAFTDTTATAAQIVAAIGAPFVGQSFYLEIKNLTAFTQTIAAGSGVTLSGVVIVPPNNVGTYLVTLTSLSAVTIFHVSTTFISGDLTPLITTLSTVGAGTITGAGIAGGITSRTGSQSGTPFTDTTDTAANIITARTNVRIGMAWVWTYVNTTNAVATLAGGTGVTPSGITSIPAGRSVAYLVTYTAAATLTMVAIDVKAAAASIQSSILAGSTSGTTTLVASAVAGSTTQTFPAVTGTVASTTGSNLFITDIVKCSTQTDATSNTTLANVTGMVATVVPGTYRIRVFLAGTAGASGGWKLAFKLTTAVITSWGITGTAGTASATARQHTTTTTDQTVLISSTAANIAGTIEGVAVIGTGGTMQLQFAQNASDGTTCSIYTDSYLEFTRIA